jgi:alkylmercury lyase
MDDVGTQGATSSRRAKDERRVALWGTLQRQRNIVTNLTSVRCALGSAPPLIAYRLAEIRNIKYSIYGISNKGREMSYDDLRVSEGLSTSVQRAVGVPEGGHETLGGLVKGIAAERWVRRPENLISEEPTRHKVRVDGRTLHTFCFVDALMLPFVLGEEAVEVRSSSLTGGEVSAVVTKEGVEGSPPEAVVSFGAGRAKEGTICETLCPYLNAFPSRADYLRWAARTPQVETVALSMKEAFDLARDWASAGTVRGPDEGGCRC